MVILEGMCGLEEIGVKYGRICKSCKWYNVHQEEVEGCPFTGMTKTEIRTIYNLDKKMEKSEKKINALQKEVKWCSEEIPYKIGFYQVSARRRLKQVESGRKRS